MAKKFYDEDDFLYDSEIGYEQYKKKDSRKERQKRRDQKWEDYD